jgi:hypothetical protein
VVTVPFRAPNRRVTEAAAGALFSRVTSSCWPGSKSEALWNWQLLQAPKAEAKSSGSTLNCVPLVMVAPPTWPTDGSGTPVVVPCPLRETDCGLPKALSEMLRAALSVPTSEGLNLMLTTQLELAASVAGEIGQVFVSPKSAVLVPAMAMEVIVSAVVPVLVTVTC